MQELRDNVIPPIRVTYKEFQKIKSNASRVNKKISPYIREMAINGFIKEKPDDRFYECLKDLR